MKLQHKISLIVLPGVAAVIVLLGLWSIRASDTFFVRVMHEIIGTNLDVYVGSTLQNIVAGAGNSDDPADLFAAQQQAFAEAQKEQLLETGHIFVVDRQGKLLFCSRGHDHLLAAHIWLPVARFFSDEAAVGSPGAGGQVHQHGLLSAVTAGDGEVLRGTTRMLQGHAHLVEGDALYAAAFFAPWQWVVISTISDQDLHGFIGSMQRATAIATLIAVLGAFVLLSLVMRRIFVKPVTLLQRAATDIADQRYVQEVPVSSGDELGSLARSMEMLSAALRRHDEEQSRWQEGLERQVAERTRELRLSNEALHHEMFQRHQAMKQSARLLQTLDQTLDSVFMFHPDTLLFSYVNRGAQLHLGYGAEELMAMTPVAIKPEFDEERFRELLAPLLRGDKQFLNFETIHRHREGRLIPVEIFLQYVVQEDHDSLCICIVRDISARKRAEVEKKALEGRLLQAHKMEAVGTLAGGIAHDFNNILASIIGFAELAQDQVGRASPAWGDMQQVLAAGQRAKELVKQILTFSRQNYEEKILLQPHPVIKETVRILRATVPSSVEIRAVISENCPRILADPAQIHQVLLNLCVNSVHAMAEKGTLRIALETVELAVEQLTFHPERVAGRYVCLAVTDSGAGIDPAIKKRIFDPFFTTKGVGEGTGMGLAMVHGIVADHGGMVEVESTPGQGATFRIFFPAAPEQKVTEPAGGALVGVSGGGHILVADDEASIVGVYKKSLEARGYTVTTAHDGQEVLDLFRAHPDAFDLVITDQTMPRLTGVELVKEVLAIRPEMPVILCSGYSSSLDAERIRELGVRRYLHKPLDLKGLAKEVREILAGHGEKEGGGIEGEE
jgi:PAS domain S-box-containing protein